MLCNENINATHLTTLTSDDWWSIYSLIDPLATDAAGSMVRSAGELGLSAVSVRMMNYDNIAQYHVALNWLLHTSTVPWERLALQH